MLKMKMECAGPGSAHREGRRANMTGSWPSSIPQSPIPQSADDETGTTWQVRRAWPVLTPGDYVLEVTTPGRPGVRGARLRRGRFTLIPPDDPKLPALQAQALKGELISYRPFRQAVIRGEDCYIKVFRPGRALVPAERCTQMDALLDPGNFTTPKMLSRGPQDVIVFSSVPGRTLAELGSTQAAVGDELFAAAWEKWSRAWVAQLTAPRGPVAQSAFDSLPLRSPEVEAGKVGQRVISWLRHNAGVPQMDAPGGSLRSATVRVTAALLRAAPDPLVWVHGDLHDKQIIATDGEGPPGLLDFDSTARGEAALDLADLDVHLELHLRQNQMAPARYLIAHTKVLAVTEELHVSPQRFHAYSDAIWLRLGTSPLPGRLPLAVAVLAERQQRARIDMPAHGML